MDDVIVVGPIGGFASQWMATGELRWIVPNATMTDMPKLQQRWIEKFSGRDEWRTIPRVVVSSQEFFAALTLPSPPFPRNRRGYEPLQPH